MNVREDREEFLLDLLETAVEVWGEFHVVPPDVLLAHEEWLGADDIIDRLIGTTWKVAFPGDEEIAITFTDLMVMLYNFHKIKERMDEILLCGGDGIGKQIHLYEMGIVFDEAIIMKPKTVQRLIHLLL